MDDKEAEKITEEFFKRRFPNKDLEFEKKRGYFGEWVGRIKSDNPEQLTLWDKIKGWFK